MPPPPPVGGPESTLPFLLRTFRSSVAFVTLTSILPIVPGSTNILPHTPFTKGLPLAVYGPKTLPCQLVCLCFSREVSPQTCAPLGPLTGGVGGVPCLLLLKPMTDVARKWPFCLRFAHHRRLLMVNSTVAMCGIPHKLAITKLQRFTCNDVTYESLWKSKIKALDRCCK